MAPKGKAATPAKAPVKPSTPAKATTPAKAATPTKAAAAPAKEEEKKAVVEKRKAEEKAEEAAPKKEAKKEEAAKVKKEDEAGAEKEKNAPADKRPAMKEEVSFNPVDTTLNVVPAAGGKLLMAATEGGMQYLIAGARANVGLKAGRYMYEVKIVEALNPSESAGAQQRNRVPTPRQLVRLGFSTSGSSPLLGETEDAVFFDSEGNFVSGKGKKVAAAQRFTRDQVIAVVLNLDPKSPNANTVSLFRDGERISEPQALPEHLVGKTLYPHVAFRSVTVQMLFGPQPAKALPFTCKMVQGAAQADVAVSPAPKPDAKYDVVFPVGLPDEGTFEWLDGFLEKNPQYTELSDRKIQEWAAASGLNKPRGSGSNDKPQFNYALPGMDDSSIRRVVNAMASVVPRHYVIMEVKANLVAADRQEVLERFSLPYFKKVAHVVMGEPSKDFKTKQLDQRLQEKQAKSDAEWKVKKAEEEKKKQLEERQKQLAEMRKKADEARKKAAEEAKKKREEAMKKKEEEKKAKEAAEKKAKEGEEGAAEGSEEKKEEAKEEAKPMEVEETKEEKKEEAKEEVKEEEKKDEEMEEKKEETPPTVELTEEEQQKWFKPVPQGICGDLTQSVLNAAFASFTIPEKKEGFDEVKFEWQKEASSKDYLQKWVQEKKLTSRIEDLQPGTWFKEKHTEWVKTYQEWQKKHREYNNSAAKKARDAAKKKEKEEKKGEEGDEAKDVEMEEAVDVFSVENVLDVGEGEPLFAKFTFEDWALLQLRVELYLLATGWQKDVDDPDRPGIRDQHISFYYTRYFRKQFNPKNFGVSSNAELCKMIKDCVLMSEDTHPILATQLAEDPETFDIFVKLTEESRRERQRRIDAGDETAKLKFNAAAVQQQPSALKPAVAGTAARPAGAFAPGAVAARPTGAAWGAGFRPGMTGVRPASAGGFPRPVGSWRK